MKKATLTILALILVQALAMAQHTGGIGRGDYSLGYPPCTNPTSGGTIASPQTINTGASPAAFTSTADPTGHTGTLEYKWQLSTTSSSSGFSDIASSNSVTYAPGTLTITTWYKRLARVSCMADWTGAAESNILMVTVNGTPAIPTLSEWGLILFGLLLLSTGTMFILRRS